MATVKRINSSYTVQSTLNENITLIGNVISVPSQITIGSANIAVVGGAPLVVSGTGAMIIPIGISTQRPGSSGNVDVAGMTRINTTINNLEYYDGSAWQTPGMFTTITDRQFTANTGNPYGNVDGVNKYFTIQSNATTSTTLVSINGAIKLPITDYTITGTNLTFVTAPTINSNVDVRVLSATATITTLSSANGLNQFVTDGTGVSLWTGSSFTTERLLVDTSGLVKMVNGSKLTFEPTATNIPIAGNPYVIDSFAANTYTSAKYVIQARNSNFNGNTESMEVLAISTGTAVHTTTYAVINDGTTMGTISANVINGNATVYYTSTSMTNTNIKISNTYIAS